MYSVSSVKAEFTAKQLNLFSLSGNGLLDKLKRIELIEYIIDN